MGLSAFPCTYVRGAWDGAGQHLDNPQCPSGMGLQVVNPKKAVRGPGSFPAGLEEAVGSAVARLHPALAPRGTRSCGQSFSRKKNQIWVQRRLGAWERGGCLVSRAGRCAGRKPGGDGSEA